MKAIIINQLTLLQGRKIQVQHSDVVKSLKNQSSIVFKQKDGIEIIIKEKHRKQEHKFLLKENCVITVDLSPWGKRLYHFHSITLATMLILIALGSLTQSLLVNWLTISIGAISLIAFSIALQTPLSIIQNTYNENLNIGE